MQIIDGYIYFFNRTAEIIFMIGVSLIGALSLWIALRFGSLYAKREEKKLSERFLAQTQVSARSPRQLRQIRVVNILLSLMMGVSLVFFIDNALWGLIFLGILTVALFLMLYENGGILILNNRLMFYFWSSGTEIFYSEIDKCVVEKEDFDCLGYLTINYSKNKYFKISTTCLGYEQLYAKLESEGLI